MSGVSIDDPASADSLGPTGRRPVALITGATAGIGNSFARQLAARGHDVVLVARDAKRLAQVAEQLGTRYAVATEVLPADLTNPEALARVAARLSDHDHPVDICVNNAGFGLPDGFLASPIADELRQLDLLTRAVLVLCHAAAPPMIERGQGAIVNVSSVAGFGPTSTYGAAKAWCTRFTEYLAIELRGTGVQATALCPGYVRTEFHERGQMDMSALPSWAWLDADDVVEDCLRDVRRGRVVSVPSVRYRALSSLMKLVPAGHWTRLLRPRDRR